MEFTLNLYSGRQYHKEEVFRQVINKDPIIFASSDNTSPSVFSILNISKELEKYILVCEDFNALSAIAYLASFSNISTRRVLVMAPVEERERAIKFSNHLLQSVKKVEIARKIRTSAVARSGLGYQQETIL